jgi:hypothetical protein
MNVVGQRFGAGGFHRINPIGQNGAEDLHHLTVAIGLSFQLALHAPQGGR